MRLRRTKNQERNGELKKPANPTTTNQKMPKERPATMEKSKQTTTTRRLLAILQNTEEHAPAAFASFAAAFAASSATSAVWSAPSAAKSWSDLRGAPQYGRCMSGRPELNAVTHRVCIRALYIRALLSEGGVCKDLLSPI